MTHKSIHDLIIQKANRFIQNNWWIMMRYISDARGKLIKEIKTPERPHQLLSAMMIRHCI